MSDSRRSALCIHPVPDPIYFYVGCNLISYLTLQIKVILTPTHLAIVMEYAAGGELFERICNAGQFSENEVLIYCIHSFMLFVLLLQLSLMPIMMCFRHASSSNNLYLGLAAVMQWYKSSAHLVFGCRIVHLLPRRYSEKSDLNDSICLL